MSIEDSIKKKIKGENVQFIRLQFTDIFGILKNVTIMADDLDKALNGEIMFDGSSIDGFARVEESDMLIVPDPDTFDIFPWGPQEDRVARFICDIYDSNGNPFSGCPRRRLKEVLAEAKEMGFTVNIGPEGEFFLFYTDDKLNPIFDIHDEAGYFDLSPIDRGERARREMILALRDLGFEIEASHHEASPGQHEIDFKYDEALRTADNFCTFKYVVKNIAQKHELYATFMPKPFRDTQGSAMHCHQSLFKGEENIFYDPNDPLELSETAKYYIGGILKHAPAITALANPTVNSYKRLVPGFEAPVNIGWSTANRSTLIRIPAGRGLGTRMELRSPDATSNPYLLFTVMIKAGIQGIKDKSNPAEPIDKNAYDMSIKDQIKAGVKFLPRTMLEAIEALEKDELILEALGSHVSSKFIEAKKTEWKEFSDEVHTWEITKYLKKY
ncbi:Glutamine synthetase type I [Candidatus Syntrophocurvum alkaliphilum]|uniref:Glutamine synthetase n=1 Tax=Candidatus Syntrophocurvum alkaliphilum TaxID=2293317 RepID=A0A6I6DCW4_9FIRM|nr:Glutamine synthetase type I [Candidatus Syntrophocurvum alkaliphilum]